jgi:SnoaL-like domain
MCGASRSGTLETAAYASEAVITLDFATEYAVRRLIHRSAELQDLGQVEELAQLFAHGEIVFGGLGHVYVGVEGVRSLLSQNVFYDANGLPGDPAQIYATTRALHYITNVDVFMDLTGSAAATSRFLIVHQRDGSPRIVFGGRYLDSFATAGDGYHFRRRIVEVHIVGDTEGYLKTNLWGA